MCSLRWPTISIRESFVFCEAGNGEGRREQDLYWIGLRSESILLPLGGVEQDYVHAKS